MAGRHTVATSVDSTLSDGKGLTVTVITNFMGSVNSQMTAVGGTLKYVEISNPGTGCGESA